MSESTPDAVAAAFAEYVIASPTAFHAAAVARDHLVAGGFTELDETQAWPSAPGAYVVVRDGAVIAWRVPEGAGATTPFRILGAHTDSPTFRLKPNPVVREHGWERLNVEVYGGPTFPSWFDRDLAVAGRVVDADGSTRLVRSGPVARIPHLAIHLDRAVNDGFAPDVQRQLLPVVGTADGPGPDDAAHWLRELVGDAVAWDLFLADTQEPARIGARGDLLASWRMDNLTSVHAGLRALLDAPDTDHIPVLAAFDHEEVGSDSVTGAGGPFLEDVLGRVLEGLGAGRSEVARAFRASWLLSSDAGHLVHPGHPEKHDPTNRPRPGGGPLLKVNARQRYTTEARGEALFAAACDRAGVTFQHYVNPNSIPGGSTIGPIAATRLGIPTLDIGVGLLSMHSTRELVHVDDLAALHGAVAAFLAG
ncbi:M18 family aminopeptidase [Phycicoccus sp. MAQZ13P-2]|uniref:M18 family aminopeptidase n=1 Tax=Phycicoccus mangrovi TaxID=2840470 RepID=UPI001BFFFB2F|nr:M18 family aminopeptidase [Phycicoccus mangrovi]MBT9255252.1 M18 family aminopeptidase [Phycicoccus mangrovi]MBT9274236.1 M18 family aminopeptidase [Phycicoccus mangrovi]